MNGYSEYRKDKRTKNLTLRDIHVGDWVQVWRPLPKEYTPPMKVSSIHYDGTVYLVSDDEGHCNPYEANIKDIDALPIDADLLRGFGFERNDYFYSFRNSVFAVDNQLDVMDFFYIDKYEESIKLGDIAYMHELQQALYEERNFIETFKPEWKGVE